MHHLKDYFAIGVFSIVIKKSVSILGIVLIIYLLSFHLFLKMANSIRFRIFLIVIQNHLNSFSLRFSVGFFYKAFKNETDIFLEKNHPYFWFVSAFCLFFWSILHLLYLVNTYWTHVLFPWLVHDLSHQ